MDSQRTNGDLTPTDHYANIQKMSRMNIFMLLITKKTVSLQPQTIQYEGKNYTDFDCGCFMGGDAASRSGDGSDT